MDEAKPGCSGAGCEEIVGMKADVERDSEAVPLRVDVDLALQKKFSLLQFEKQIFLDVMENDALTIFAKGLSYARVVSSVLWAHADPAHLVLVVNAGDGDEKYFSERLGLTALPALAAEREKTYLSGGVHFVSTRVLVVDLLKGRVPTAHVSGVVVLRAHSVLESCQEAFALRLYRQTNKTGFIKAFSNSPISFTFGYGHVEKVMRSLFLTELFLWPRFHGSVIKCLKAREARVVELHVPLPDNTAHVQRCLLDLINYTIRRLKATERNLTLQYDNTQEVTTENCISNKFHKALQAQLDPVWHQLSTRTKEHVQDLKILRSLLLNLIHDDAISFYALVSKYRTPEYAHVNSGWILLDSAEQLFRLAKGRVYNSKKEFDPEPCPKWQCLSDLLTKEIPEQRSSAAGARILILCRDTRTCSQLNGYLTMGASKFLFYRAFRKNVPLGSVAAKYRDVSRTVRSDYEKEESIKKNKSEEGNNENTLEKALEDEEELYAEECNKSNYVLTLTQVANTGDEASGLDQSTFEPCSQMENMDMTMCDLQNPLICIQTFKDYSNHFSLESTLEAFRPEYIVMYHSDVAAIRQIEVYESRKGASDSAVSVYLILHNQTVEEQAYLTSLKREKQAFEHLIQTKSVMVVPSYQDGKTDELFNLHVEEEDENVDTRKAGGQKSESKERPLVIVDMREFRSDLPALLHRRGAAIEPVTITVGDYILTPDICVERKSISDLIGSLHSGRLYTQCTNMCRHYARPVLLIEFDQNKPFNLQGILATSSEAPGAEVQQKLQLLTIHFPRLKLVWSPSPYATAQLFHELKQGRKNPSVADTIALHGDAGEEASCERYNTLVHDFLRKLPGVTSKNIDRLMNRAGSLDRLVTLTQEQLAEELESPGDAGTLHAALHMRSRPSAAAASRDDRPHKNKYTARIFRKGDGAAAKKPRAKAD